MNITTEILKLVAQLVVLGFLGGAVRWFYARIQKNRELRIQLLRDFAALHGRSISLRFEFNWFYVEGRGDRNAEFHPLSDDEVCTERWKYFQQACGLLGGFQSLKPLLEESFSKI